MLALPAALGLGFDLARRPGHLATFDALHVAAYVGSTLLTLVFWASWLSLAARRTGALRWVARGAFVVLYGLSVGVQGAFFRFYRVYCSHDAILEYQSFGDGVTCAMPWDERTELVPYLLSGVLLACACLVAARAFVRLPTGVFRRLHPAALVVTIAGLAIPASYRVWQSSSPDHIYVHALVINIRENIPLTRRVHVTRAQRRSSTPLPPLSPVLERPRNVLFILQESVRADAYCSGYDPDCARAGRFTNALLPERMAFDGMRAVDSSTVISMSVLLSGLSPTEPFETLHRVPYVWSYAKRAGYFTAYWTSQHTLMFGTRYLIQDEPLDISVVGTQLDTGASSDTGASDALLADRVIRDWDKLKEPFFAMVQTANAHSPYAFDPNDAPMESDKGKSKDSHRDYLNAIYASDKALARVIQHVRESDAGSRTVILFTSDHGEEFNEHKFEGHTKSVYDIELRVPAWLDAPTGTLTKDELKSVQKVRSKPTYHLEIAPTLLDLLGLWDAPEIGAWRSKMPGLPLTRRERMKGPVALSNCSWIWQCRNANWGMMNFPMKLLARNADKGPRYQCFDLQKDPGEKNDLGEQACGPLADSARALFPVMPNEVPFDRDPPL